MCNKKFLIFCVLLSMVLAGNCPGAEPALHLKVDLALAKYNGGIWEQTLKPGWIPWAQPRWHDMYGHDCVMANGTGEEAGCGESYEGKPGLGDTGIMAGMSCVYEGRGGLLAAGLEMCNLNATCGPPAVSGDVLYDPICNTCFQITDFPAVPGSNILLAFYNMPAGEYTLISYHNRYGGERNGGQPHWECICDPQPPMSEITALAVAGTHTLYNEYGSNYEWQKFKGQYDDLGSSDGVQLLQADYDVEIQQVTRDEDLVPSVIKFRTDGSAVMVIYEGNCCEMVPDDIRPQRESQRAVLNAFELILDSPRMTAGMPTPFNGAQDVSADTALSWLAGHSGLLHDVYFGTDADSVAGAADPNTSPGHGRVPAVTFDPGGLELGNTYYWRIDEVNHAEPDSPWKGELWSFTTAACVTKESFESYADMSALQQAWSQGGGAWIELRTEEQHEGLKSMELQYFNRSGYKFSEAGMTFDSPQDFSSGVDSVAFFFKGVSSNGADKMYIALEDTAGESAAAFYDGDVGDVRTETWKGWGAKLDRFKGIDLTAIEKVFIGVGDRDASRPSAASGVLYIDDVSLCVPSCMEQVHLMADWTGDCVVNFEDHAILAGEWHKNDMPVQPVSPDPAALKAWYKFENNARDSSGNGNDGVFFRKEGTANPRWDPGKRDNCIYFGLDETNYGVLIADESMAQNLFSDIDEAITISLWVKGSPTGPDTSNVIIKAQQPLSGPTRFVVIEIRVDSRTGQMTFSTGLGRRDALDVPPPESWGLWNHYAFVKDAAAGRQQVYINGCPVAGKKGATVSLAGVGTAAIGLARDDYRDGFFGWMDDFRIYDRALSQAEVVGVMAEGEQYCGLDSIVNIYDEEPEQQKIIDFKDYAALAENWLIEQLWP